MSDSASASARVHAADTPLDRDVFRYLEQSDEAAAASGREYFGASGDDMP